MFYKLIISLIMIAIAAPCVAIADELTVKYSFEWDHNPEPDVADYRLWRRPFPFGQQLEYDGNGQIIGPTDAFECPDEEVSSEFGVDLNTCKRVGYVNATDWTDLPGVRLCFVVTAIDTEGFESDYSNQVCTLGKIKFKIRVSQ